MLSKPSAVRKIPVRMALRAVDGGYELTAEMEGGQTRVYVPTAHQEAQKPQRENIVRQLSKLGDTIYECAKVDVPDDFNYFIPNSQLSEMRRTLVEKMMVYEADGNRTSQPEPVPMMHAYPYPYLYNIANHQAAAFYGTDELSAYELKGGAGPIMQCRHCIRYSLGYCVRNGGKRPTWREPLSLVLGDGRRFRLEFDCQHCQMNIYAP